MTNANEIKRGMAVELAGKKLLVKDIFVQNPSARGAATLYKMRFKDIESGAKVEERFKGDEKLQQLDLTIRGVSFSYIDGDEYVFMDNEDYSQFNFKCEDIEDELLFITQDTQGLQLLEVNGNAVGIDLPQWVELVISETSPSIKGASASARTKPAHFETGLVVQVPEYIATGEKIKINVAEKKFVSRAGS
ncbi:elongation factor P-like protein YeiP [Psychrobium sp. MM17-31]|uniref:elongation factor P-like protein EfpL n=1 Tax=Psychrobium sp. MM17-31 TaxID=2917758 RepID=UPI001EF5621E|nr:elongation factor P-like protein YeiP [Psychrobium sp. MM17-31]MCG7529876.1 elongation factor P-like protein YeiP [Psychrobium sp. MM17-31]